MLMHELMGDLCFIFMYLRSTKSLISLCLGECLFVYVLTLFCVCVTDGCRDTLLLFGNQIYTDVVVHTMLCDMNILSLLCHSTVV